MAESFLDENRNSAKPKVSRRSKRLCPSELSYNSKISQLPETRSKRSCHSELSLKKVMANMNNIREGKRYGDRSSLRPEPVRQVLSMLPNSVSHNKCIEERVTRSECSLDIARRNV